VATVCVTSGHLQVNLVNVCITLGRSPVKKVVNLVHVCMTLSNLQVKGVNVCIKLGRSLYVSKALL
jgi:hypothetical protein